MLGEFWWRLWSPKLFSFLYFEKNCENFSKKSDFFWAKNFEIFFLAKKNLKTQKKNFAQIFSENFPTVLETISDHLGAIGGR